MSETTFDTLRYAKRLKEVGLTDQQAEVHAEALKELIDEKLATKSDIIMLKRDIAEMGMKMTIRFGGMLIAAVLVLAAIIKF